MEKMLALGNKRRCGIAGISRCCHRRRGQPSVVGNRVAAGKRKDAGARESRHQPCQHAGGLTARRFRLPQGQDQLHLARRVPNSWAISRADFPDRQTRKAGGASGCHLPHQAHGQRLAIDSRKRRRPARSQRCRRGIFSVERRLELFQLFDGGIRFGKQHFQLGIAVVDLQAIRRAAYKIHEQAINSSAIALLRWRRDAFPPTPAPPRDPDST